MLAQHGAIAALFCGCMSVPSAGYRDVKARSGRDEESTCPLPRKFGILLTIDSMRGDLFSLLAFLKPIGIRETTGVWPTYYILKDKQKPL